MDAEKNIRIKLKSDNTENWHTNNPVLLEGELAINTETGSIKIGNNTTYEESLKGNFKVDARGYKILEITDTGYKLSSVIGIEAGMRISARLATAAIDCAEIIGVNEETNEIILDSIPPLDFDTDEEDLNINFIPNYITIVGHPELGDTYIGFGTYAVGENTIASERGAWAQGRDTKAFGQYGHAEGRGTKAGFAAHAEGRETYAQGDISHASGYSTTSSGFASHSEGELTESKGRSSHAEGIDTTATGDHSHSEGQGTESIGKYSHVEGWDTISTGSYSHAEGARSQSIGSYSHAEGVDTKSIGLHSHAEGSGTTASGTSSHAEGEGTTASDRSGHAEGYHTTAESPYSHAEGYGSTTSNYVAHAEGQYTTASGWGAHAEGQNTVASGTYAHAEGIGTIANYNGHTVVGSYNDSSATGQLFTIGNGTSDSKRSNLLEATSNSVTLNKKLLVKNTTDNAKIVMNSELDHNTLTLDTTAGLTLSSEVSGDMITLNRTKLEINPYKAFDGGCTGAKLYTDSSGENATLFLGFQSGGGYTYLDNDGLKFDNINGLATYTPTTISLDNGSFIADCNEGLVSIESMDNQTIIKLDANNEDVIIQDCNGNTAHQLSKKANLSEIEPLLNNEEVTYAYGYAPTFIWHKNNAQNDITKVFCYDTDEENVVFYFYVYHEQATSGSMVYQYQTEGKTEETAENLISILTQLADNEFNSYLDVDTITFQLWPSGTPDNSAVKIVRQHFATKSELGNLSNAIDSKAPSYLYSTTDLTAGTSALTTGQLYFVYE